ncbi:MAG: nitroreductase family protein [Bacteroidota bacterium]
MFDPKAVAAAIQARQTFKVLGDPDAPVQFSAEAAAQNQQVVLEALRVAGWAPFHYARGTGGLAEPWRAHVLWHEPCQHLAHRLFEWFPDLSPSSKIPRMLAACGALALVTWLPQFGHVEDPKPAQVRTDEEHLMASSAMVQNLLLLLTAHGMGTYWSSGGVLGSAPLFRHLGIPETERLLAAVFVEYPETLGEDRERRPGKHRASRSDGWISEVAVEGA